MELFICTLQIIFGLGVYEINTDSGINRSYPLLECTKKIHYGLKGENNLGFHRCSNHLI